MREDDNLFPSVGLQGLLALGYLCTLAKGVGNTIPFYRDETVKGREAASLLGYPAQMK